jgi:hypothetical protein
VPHARATRIAWLVRTVVILTIEGSVHHGLMKSITWNIGVCVVVPHVPHVRVVQPVAAQPLQCALAAYLVESRIPAHMIQPALAPTPAHPGLPSHVVQQEESMQPG